MKVAYCILTHNSVDVLLEVSKQYFEIYEQNGVDIYLYDSSTDTQTYSLYKAWLIKGITNLYYVDCKDIPSGTAKHLKVLQGYGLNGKYDYIWPTKDRIFVSESHLRLILDKLEDKPDVVLTARKNDSFFYDIPEMPEYFDEPVGFFKYYGATSTSWNCVLFNFTTMLQDINWEEYDSTYGINENNSFNQTSVLFIRLADMKNCSITVVRPQPMERLGVPSNGSSWINETVELWGKRWPNAINNLPSIYEREKAYVIKTECMHPLVFGSIDHLTYIMEKKWFTKGLFDEIRDDFSLYSDIPAAYIDLMLERDFNTLYGLLYDDFVKAIRMEDYYKAMWILQTASPLKKIMGIELYNKFTGLLTEYQNEMMNNGVSHILDNVTI